MSTKQPTDPHDNDEVLTFLARMERLLLRVIEGIGVFFVRRLPHWIYQILNTIVERIHEYLGWIGRVLVRLVRVGALVGVLLAILIGVPVALGSVGAHSIIVFTFVILEVIAILYAMRRYLVKERERQRQLATGAVGRRQVCAHCRTEPAEHSPLECKFCGAPWRGVPG